MTYAERGTYGFYNENSKKHPSPDWWARLQNTLTRRLVHNLEVENSKASITTTVPKFLKYAKKGSIHIKLSLIAMALGMVVAGKAAALDNSAQVPVFLYHSGEVASPCNYSSYASVALAADLETFENWSGGRITVVPLYWIAEWAMGLRDGSTLPDKVVGITTDDGNDLDWIDLYLPAYACGPTRTSFKTVLQNFKTAHPTLPWYSPHVSSFVIASPVARSWLSPGGPTGPQYWTDGWWATAQASGIMEIYNHGTDHDTGALTYQQYDSSMGNYVPIGGYYDGNWWGYGNFSRTINYATSYMEITKAASFISGKTGVWPDLFAYPYGNATAAAQSYFVNYPSQHQTLAAFTTSGQYVSRASNRWTMGRFVWNSHWSTPTQMNSILTGAGY